MRKHAPEMRLEFVERVVNSKNSKVKHFASVKEFEKCFAI